MIGQNAKVQHIRVGKQYPASFLYVRSLRARRVAIESGYLSFGKEPRTSNLSQASPLVMRESLGREDIQGTAIPVIQRCFKRWQVITQALSAGTRCGHDDIVPCKNSIQRFHLMSIKTGYPKRLESCLKDRVQSFVQLAKDRSPHGNVLHVNQLSPVVARASKVTKKSSSVHQGLPHSLAKQCALLLSRLVIRKTLPF